MPGAWDFVCMTDSHRSKELGACGVRHLSLGTWSTVPSLVEFSTGSPEQASLIQNRLSFMVPHDKTFKSLKKDIKEDIRRWKDNPCS